MTMRDVGMNTSRNLDEGLIEKIGDLASVPIAVWDGDGLSYANPAFETLTGYQQSELRAMCWSTLLAPEYRDAVLRDRERLATQAGEVRCEVLLVGRDGDQRWIEQTLKAHAADGRTVVVITAVDQSLRKQTERALAASQERYRRLFDEDLAGAAMITPNGRVLECNAAMARILDVEQASALVSRDLADFFQDPLFLARILATVIAEGRTENKELQLRRSDGETIVVVSTFTANIDQTGQLSSVRMLVLEVTDRRRIEAKLLGIQRTEAIGRLAGGLAHDYNNLLTVIGGHSDYLLESLQPDDWRRDSVKAIQQASRRAAVLTRQLLAFGRRQLFNLRVVEIGRLLEEAQPLLANAVGDRITVTCHVSDPPRTKADPTQMEHVLLNLALNARDAMPEGGTVNLVADRLVVAPGAMPAQPWVQPGSYLRIHVTDTGIGMDPLVRAHIFEPFFTTKQPGHGSGLGLATVYGIVKQSNGYVWVDSELGRGTTFTLLFPALDEAASQPAQARTEKVAPTETILVVDSDDSLRALLAEALRRRGYHVLDAASVDRAAEMFGAYTGRVQLLLSDLAHPGGSGAALAERLRGIVPELRALFMYDATPYPRPVATAANAFIQKPFSLQALADKVREVLDASPEKLGPAASL
jgi:PAS domain S-box-containing protein